MRSRRFLLAGALLAASVLGHAEATADPRRWLDLGRPTAGSTNVSTASGVRLAAGPNRAAEMRTGFAVDPLDPGDSC